MSVFEKLDPFVSLCQACGMIPYTIKRNSDTSQFEKFTFSFKHFNTWWFFFMLVFQLSLFSAAPLFYRDVFQALLSDRTMPLIFTILTGTVSFSYLAQFLTCRWIILRYKQLRNAVEAVQEVERLFGEQFLAQHQSSSLVRRTAIGFTLAVTTV
jgi:gustatory receptor